MAHIALSRGLLPTPAARLTPPQPAYWTVPRPRLEALLEEVLSRRLTVVNAGAGFGKTTLLAAWAGHTHTAWYTLAADDRTPTVLGYRAPSTALAHDHGTGARFSPRFTVPFGVLI